MEEQISGKSFKLFKGILFCLRSQVALTIVIFYSKMICINVCRQAMAEDERVDLLSFTGSTPVSLSLEQSLAIIFIMMSLFSPYCGTMLQYSSEAIKYTTVTIILVLCTS